MPVSAADDILLVAGPEVTALHQSREAVRAMFAMRQRTWPDGSTVHVFVLPNHHPVHKRFTKQQLGVYPHQLQLAWDRLVFSGMGQAPDCVSSLDEMREKLATTPGALGYLESVSRHDGVHVIFVE